MSQFLVIVGDVRQDMLPSGVSTVQALKDVDVKRVIRSILPEHLWERAWTVLVDGHHVDNLFTEAQHELNRDRPFGDTRLGRVMAGVQPSCCEALLWYSDDWSDLPQILDWKALVEAVEEGIRQPSCEVYAHYKRSRDDESANT